MPIAFNCPSCQKKLTVKDEMAGKVAQCPCGTKLKIPQGTSAPAPGTTQPTSPQATTPLATGAQGTASSAFESAFAGTQAGTQPMAGPQPASQPAQGQAGPQAPAPENLQNLNPDFKVQCIQCGQQYPMRPDLYGQTVACKCGAPIRFDDPLGAGGALINHDPLGLGAAMEADPNQPVAYQSLSQPNQTKNKARAREDEVLKMYIKDEDEPTVKKSRAESGPRKVNAKPASFGMRLGALLVDGLIMLAIQQAIFWPVYLMAPDLFKIELTGDLDTMRYQIYTGSMLPFMVAFLGIYVAWLIMEIGMATTPGKMAIGLVILDGSGRKPSTDALAKRALLKYGGTIVNMTGYAFALGSLFIVTDILTGVGGLIGLVFFVGCLMALGEKKRALHDDLSGTIVSEA